MRWARDPAGKIKKNSWIFKLFFLRNKAVYACEDFGRRISKRQISENGYRIENIKGEQWSCVCVTIMCWELSHSLIHVAKKDIDIDNEFELVNEFIAKMRYHWGTLNISVCRAINLLREEMIGIREKLHNILKHLIMLLTLTVFICSTCQSPIFLDCSKSHIAKISRRRISSHPSPFCETSFFDTTKRQRRQQQSHIWLDNVERDW